MMAHNVQARLDKRTEHCSLGCPGWVVRDERPVVTACEACNALQPERLRVTTGMVKLLPVALDRLRAATFAWGRTQSERMTTRHITSAFTDARGLCGRGLGKTRNKRRNHVRTANPGASNCDECIRLNAMTPAQREEERKNKSKALQARFSDQKLEADREREARNAVINAEIEQARIDAQVAWDILLLFDFDRVMLHAKVLDERAELVERTLEMACKAHRQANPKNIAGHAPAFAKRRWLFVKVADPYEYSNRRHRRDVVCRFCDQVLLHNRTLGTDYTVQTDDHTVRCALRYLGAEPEQTSDVETTDEFADDADVA